MQRNLPILSNITLDYIWLSVFSCSIEYSFSIYNNLLNSDHQNLSCESLKKLTMLYILIKVIRFNKIIYIFTFYKITKLIGKSPQNCTEYIKTVSHQITEF